MDIVLRAVFFYFLTLIVLRVTTRRIGRSATPLDMVIFFLLGGFSLQAITGDDKSATSAVISIATIALVHVGISLLKEIWPVVGMITDGTPIIVYSDDEWHHGRLLMARVQRRDVLAEMRLKGLRSMEEVEYAIVEHNGSINIIPKKKGS